MAFRFEQLQIWQKAFQLSNQINELAKQFPTTELYNLSSQIKRAADSVVLNIAEGSTGQSKPEFRKFLSYALRSAIEVVACLFMAKERLYITENIFNNLYSAYENLCKMITKFRSSLVKDVKI
jgi:four helix bundle protein